MKKMNWKQAREAMRDLQPERAGIDKETFWRTFQARTANVPREDTVTTKGVELVSGLSLGWAGAMAAMVAIIAGLLIWVSVPPADTPVQAGDNQIHSVQVTASNNGVEILRDDSSETTILWISDME